MHHALQAVLGENRIENICPPHRLGLLGQFCRSTEGLREGKQGFGWVSPIHAAELGPKCIQL